ncbi:MAG: GspH/FimT family pseudopilin [Gemmatimonadaceae bacterium]
MNSNRPGFSFTELMIVFVLLGIITAIGVPRFDYARDSSHVRSARDQVASFATTARAAAIQRGRSARFSINQNAMLVEVQDSTGAWVNLRQPIALDQAFAVAVRVEPTGPVTFNPRGIARIGGTQRYIISRGAAVDSVCLTGLGVVKRKGC